jgi:hypothetical protein
MRAAAQYHTLYMGRLSKACVHIASQLIKASIEGSITPIRQVEQSAKIVDAQPHRRASARLVCLFFKPDRDPRPQVVQERWTCPTRLYEVAVRNDLNDVASGSYGAMVTVLCGETRCVLGLA